MIHCFAVGHFARERDGANEFGVQRGAFATRLVPIVEVAQFDAQDRRLQFVEPGIHTLDIARVAFAPTILSK